MRAPSAWTQAATWLAGRISSEDVLAFAGIAAVAWGLGLDNSAGWVALGAGLFYLGAVSPLLTILVIRRRD